MEISKKLLSEVLGLIKITHMKTIENKVYISTYLGEPIKWNHIYNIHELAHKCKIWAISNGYILFSSAYKEAGLCLIIEDSSSVTIDDATVSVKQKTEPEAIFKACEWILDNKKDKR